MPQNREKCKRERENKTHRRADRVVRPYKEFRRGRWSCCGAQNFCAALRRTLKILTAATRSLRFLCHRQRSVRSPHRPAVLHSLKKPCHCEPVTDVTGVAIRSPRPLRRGITDSHDQSADWSRNDTQIPSASVIARAQGARGNPFPRPYAFIPSSHAKKRWPGGHLCDCRKTLRVFRQKACGLLRA